MKYLYRILVMLGLLVLQFSIIPRFPLGVIEPDLLLGMTILISLFRGIEAGCISGLILGLFSDANMGILLGSKALCWTQVGFAVALIGERLMIENKFVQTTVVFTGCMLAGVFQVIFYRVSAIDEPFWNLMFTTLMMAIATSLLTIPLAALMSWMKLLPKEKNV